MALSVPQAEMRKMIEQAELSYPTEGCGLLIGLDSEERRAQEARPCLNAVSEMARTRYKIDPRTLLETEMELANSGTMILGFYHSHPDCSAQPSEYDLEHAWPWYSYLILSVKRGHFEEAVSWRLSGDMTYFEREEVKITDGT